MKVLLVDDHALFREGLRALLTRMRSDFELFDAGDCATAFQIAGSHPDLGLILLDLELPDMRGARAIEVLRQRHPDVPVVVLSATEDRPTILECINSGAMGFIPKSSDSTVFMSAVQLVFAKGVYVPASALTSPYTSTETTPATAVLRKAGTLRELGLTQRQIEVLGLVVQGLSNKSIAHRLALSEATVKNHVTAGLRALNVANRTQAVLAIGQLRYTFEP